MTAVQMTQDFQARIFEKIRADIGTLMTDEDIKKLVEATIERTFFQPVKRLNSSGYRDEFDPPRIEGLMKELVEPSLRKAIDAWLKDHQAEVQAAVDKALSGGMTSAVARAFDSILSSAMASLQYNLVQALQFQNR